MLGFIILIGVVVNNAILMVDQALNFMRGSARAKRTDRAALARDAIRESVSTRIRPIFMTTGTSVLGMLPFALAPGAGSELYRGLGAVVVGGLTCSTLFTLVVAPLLFSLVVDAQTLWCRALPRRRDDLRRHEADRRSRRQSPCSQCPGRVRSSFLLREA